MQYQRQTSSSMSLPPENVPIECGSVSCDSTDDVTMEGYDNEFVPPVTKHECPICLMCLREPCQTDCGHRFCKSCIKRWLRSEELEKKCPACNAVLTTTKVYPDNYAKREINLLQAKCRYAKHGCDKLDNLKTILSHQDSCSYRQVRCQYDCGQVLCLKDLKEHEANCDKRTVVCNLCRLEVESKNFSTHQTRCSLVTNSCIHCGETLRSEGGIGNLHDCPQMKELVPCRFSKFGCTYKASRAEMRSHMEVAQVQHLNVLASAVENIVERPAGSETDMQALEEHLSTLLTGNSGDSSPIVPNQKRAIPAPEEDEIAKLKSQNSSQGATAPSATSSTKEKFNLAGSDYSLAPESEVALELREKIANQVQYIIELQSKVAFLERTLNETRSEIREARMDMKSRACNGVYIWKVNNYKNLREEAMAGSTASCVLHSPGFYTSYHGYQFCIRLNLNGVENVQGTHLSLFIHLMQSENDDILSWPFTGRVTLSILDQHETSMKRKHITETLIAKPGLAAFQRPKSFRNHKGFGYMEFAPISFLEGSDDDRQFIKNDSLLIKAEVKPSS